MSLDEQLGRELSLLDERGLRRQLRRVEGRQRAVVRVDGVEAINFSSNNYLGLADHPRLVERATVALREQGVGAGAARLIVGNMSAHRELEAAAASFQETESALLFASGYQANVGVLAALAGPEDALFSDALNHASLIDGCRLSRATTHVYRHGDVAHLDELLSSVRARRKLVVTDTIFSMDGDLAPLAGLREVSLRHGAFLVVDEAHATGVVGPAGRGLAAACGVRADVHVATLGKALGCSGAYVAGSTVLTDYLLNRCRSFVFTTGSPPVMAAAATEALSLASGPEGDRLRKQLASNIRIFREGLDELGLLAAAAGSSPIFPIVLGEERRALRASSELLMLGVFAQAIRPPTVAPGTARLRVSLMATHTEEQIRFALAAFDKIGLGR